ncbi:hypothetical protein [Paraurantiacibacter namhicola]|nr:hypothetical protein [Paraurantiacibacter namhicola]
MKKLIAAAAILSVPAAVSAQTPDADPQDDLKCAAWSAMIAGQMQDDEKTANAFGLAMTYFIGRYEGATGRDIAKDLTPEIVMDAAGNMEATTEFCAARMESLGRRMEGLGTALKAAGDAEG